MGYIVAAGLVATVTVGSQLGALSSPGIVCKAPLVRPLVDGPRLRGPDEITSRLRIVRQPDSPATVTAIDFSKTTLTVSPGYFEWQGSYTLEIANISDRPLREIRATVYVRFENLSGIGNGVHFDEIVAPGARLQLVGRASGHGTSPASRDVTVDVVVESVRWDGCVYRPSQAIPLVDVAK